MTDLWTERGVRFIERNKDRPFFLYLAYNGPYGLGNLLKHPARNRHAAYYADQPLFSFPRDAMHPWLFNNKEFLNSPMAIRRVAAETSGVDDGVGAIMDTLRRLGLDHNTLVVYAGDQGWMGGQNGIWGMGDHTRPAGAHELMMHIPLLFRQPGRIAAGRTSDLIVSNYDFLPAVLAYLGLGDKTPGLSPGRDFSPVLAGGTIAWENVMFYEMENTRAIRTERWKYVARHPSGPFELYDMETDPRERFNLYGQPDQAERTPPLAASSTVSSSAMPTRNMTFGTAADPRQGGWSGRPRRRQKRNDDRAGLQGSTLLRPRARPEAGQVLDDPRATAHAGEEPSRGQAHCGGRGRGRWVAVRDIDEDRFSRVPLVGFGEEQGAGVLAGDARADLTCVRRRSREQESGHPCFIGDDPERSGMLFGQPVEKPAAVGSRDVAIEGTDAFEHVVKVHRGAPGCWFGGCDGSLVSGKDPLDDEAE